MEGVRQLAAASLPHGIHTTVVCLDAPGQVFLEGDAFASVALGPVGARYGYTRHLVPWLRVHAREFDAVIVNGLWQYIGLAVWRALRATGVPYFVFPHGMLDPYFRKAYPLKHLKKSLYWLGAEYRVLRDARAVLFTCEEERRLGRRVFWPYRAQERVVGFGTAPPPVAPAPALVALHKAFPHLQGRPFLLFLGRIHEKKGCDLLLDAYAALVRDKKNEWNLVMAGPVEPAYGRVLREQAHQMGIADRVTWTGMLAGDAKWGALYAADAFVLPSHQENFGIAVAEALACGTPVLVSNKVNIWREVVAGDAGMVADDTAQGARELLEGWAALDAHARARLREGARRCFDQHFDMQAVARDLAASLLDLCQVPAALAVPPGALPAAAR